MEASIVLGRGGNLFAGHEPWRQGRQQAQVRDTRCVVVSAMLSARWLRWKKQSTSLRAFDTGKHEARRGEGAKCP